MVLLEDSSCTTDCDESANDEWINAAAELKTQQSISNEPIILLGSLDKNSIDSDSDLNAILDDVTKYPAVKIFGCEICPAEIKQFTGEITQAAVVEQATKIAAFNNPVISLDDDIFESVTDLPLDGSIVPYSEGSDFSWIIAVKKVPCNDCVLLEGTMNGMATDVAIRTENKVKMAVIDADVNPLLSNAYSGDSNPMLWIVKPDGNKVDVSSQGFDDCYCCNRFHEGLSIPGYGPQIPKKSQTKIRNSWSRRRIEKVYGRRQGRYPDESCNSYANHRFGRSEIKGIGFKI